MADETWDLWMPGAGSSGLPFARATVDGAAAGDRLLVHAAPERLDVVVRDGEGRTVAAGAGLERSEPGPMSFLVRDGDEVRLEDGWPGDGDIGRLVILPGGEAGVLVSWWHAEDRSSWRWRLELANSI